MSDATASLSTTVQYFIYYRVREELDAEVAQAAVRAMQAELERTHGVRGRLLTRLNEPATWMEVYADVADPTRFEAALGAAVNAAALDSHLAEGTVRHIERFIECA